MFQYRLRTPETTYRQRILSTSGLGPLLHHRRSIDRLQCDITQIMKQRRPEGIEMRNFTLTYSMLSSTFGLHIMLSLTLHMLSSPLHNYVIFNFTLFLRRGVILGKGTSKVIY